MSVCTCVCVCDYFVFLYFVFIIISLGRTIRSMHSNRLSSNRRSAGIFFISKHSFFLFLFGKKQQTIYFSVYLYMCCDFGAN